MPESQPPQFPDYPFLRNGGEMGELTRNYDWASHPLGLPENWPVQLKQLTGIMLGTPSPMLICWGNDFIQLYNDAFRPILGENKHPQALGIPVYETYAEVWEILQPLFGQVMQGEAVAYNDFKLHVNRNGYWEDLCFDFSYSPITDENKEIKGILVICTETTARVAALQGANESEYRFRTMAEESDILIALSDESSKAVYFSKAWTDLTGRSMEDLLAFGWVDLLHPDDRDRYMNIYLSAFEKQVSFTGDFRVLSKTGDYRWLLAKGPPRFRSDGSFAGYISSCIDITERKANEQGMQQLINMLPASVVVIRGPELIVEMINQANLDYWNKTAAEVVGKPFLEILPDLADQPFAGQLRQVMDTGEIIDVKESPVLFENPDGSIRETFVDYTYQPLTDNNGKRTGVLVMSFEITERVTARRLLEKYVGEMHSLNEEMAASNEELATTNEELTGMQQRLEDINQELETSTSRLRMAIESTSLGTWEYNLTSSEFYCSKEFRTVYGFPDDHAVTYQAFIEHVHPDDLKGVEEAIQQATTPGKSGYYELTYRILRFNNYETRWIKAQGTVYFDQGRVSRFIGTVLDITEIKAAEEKSAKLAAIIASSDDAIISKTLDSVITSWNDAAERIFGYRADEMIGETIYKLIPLDRYEEEPLILARLRTGERVDHFETKRRTKDGRLIDVSVTISPVKNNEGRIIGLSKIARDITEKKLDEARKNDFIGMVSHELKTPLTSLNAIIQLVGLKLKQSEDGFLTGAMEKANHQVKRMTAMINGFLNVSRLESGKIHIEKQQFDIEKLINDIIEEARLTTGTHHIAFNPCTAMQINADRDKIGSVISNLISNAIKYSPKGKNVMIQCIKHKNEVIISFQDEGIGIKPDDLDKIFDRYYRVETNQHISGFGIGLYLSAEIIERHNGRIWAESESGIGSTFYFSLPL